MWLLICRGSTTHRYNDKIDRAGRQQKQNATMKIPPVGRNDPCPCGSGKKFKNCCLGREDAVASDRGATGASAELRKALEDGQFGSLAEMQAFVERLTQQRNQRPLDEFQGLSPEQMHHLLNFPYASPEQKQNDALAALPAAAPPGKVAYLFVYGTLRRGACSNMQHFLARYAAFVGAGTCQGRLYKIHAYPGVESSENPTDQVLGEVYRLREPDLVLPRLDQYEQCGPGLPEPAEYVREQQEVCLSGGERLTAWVYIYNRPTDALALIPSGDFLKTARG